MRLFTAIPIPIEKKDLVQKLTFGRLPVSYINTTNLHVTLNFFGELEEKDVEVIAKIMDEVLENEDKIEIVFDKITKFRQQIHLTLKPNQKLEALYGKLESVFYVSGFMLHDRNYYPHVKLSNLHMDQVMNQQRKLENFPNEELAQLNFVADRVMLYESKLLMHHAKYTVLKEFNLSYED